MHLLQAAVAVIVVVVIVGCIIRKRRIQAAGKKPDDIKVNTGGDQDAERTRSAMQRAVEELKEKNRLFEELIAEKVVCTRARSRLHKELLMYVSQEHRHSARHARPRRTHCR